MKKIGILKVSMDLLHVLLDLPSDSKIAHVRVDPEKFNVVDIMIESPYLSEMIEGQVIPTVSLREIRGWDE